MQIADSGRVATIDAFTPVGRNCLQEANRVWQVSQGGAC
jgi:hypothetical protein